ncbi:MAG: galactose mutarotase [Ruminococcaceae bacterium]|nr:galactose mutarotase [Oscillospiraceae bacterium]
MSISKKLFGKMPCGKEVYCWTITNGNMSADIIDYGATLRSLIVPDKNGNPTDVVLGYDTVEEYINNDGYIGATVGRFANRICKGKFTLNGKEYTLATNDGPNHLHGGNIGYDKMVWDIKDEDGELACYLTSPDGDEGYPGTLEMKVTYALKDGGLSIHYEAASDKDTIFNPTNHAYFNLDGEGKINEQYLKINADYFTPNDADCLPTGELKAVEGTSMDFKDFHTIAERADMDEYVKPYGGYDVNFVLNVKSPACEVYSDKNGIVMQVETTEPGVQLYTGNGTSDRLGKNGAQYGWRSAFCLETQHYPDCINHPEWPSCILKAGIKFDSTTVYKFKTK